MTIQVGISPCPNDTFIFAAIINRWIDCGAYDFNFHFEDVQTLNEWALAEKMHVCKVSFHAYLHLPPTYQLLKNGGALGKGVGPLLIATTDRLPSNYKVAIPGALTTAHLLFNYYKKELETKKVFMPFDQIERAVLTGDVDAGVIIHENRFTYADKGLTKLIDLGGYWEEQTGLPIPLGGIVAKGDAPIQKQEMENLIARSLEFAYQNSALTMDFVRKYAQEMEAEVMLQHINLYVNDYTKDMGSSGQEAIKLMKTLL